MIRIWYVKYPKSVWKDEQFTIGWCTLYFTFPFRKLYTQIWKDGKVVKREQKTSLLFGIWYNKISDTIESDTTYEIKVGEY